MHNQHFQHKQLVFVWIRTKLEPIIDISRKGFERLALARLSFQLR